MEAIIIITISAAAISLTIYLTLKNRHVCPSCGNKKIIATGKKEYLENPPLAVWGSPDSYQELEYKCESCSNIFWKKKKAVIIN